MEFTKLLEERRSIRAFDPEKHVTAEQIQEIVQAAIQAPSWKNSQTTRYYALVTPEKVEEFSAKCLPEFNQKSSKGAALVVTAFVKDRSVEKISPDHTRAPYFWLPSHAQRTRLTISSWPLSFWPS